MNALSQSGELVVNPGSEPLPDGAIDAKSFACGDLTDLSVALTGQHPRDVWLTRLEAFLPKASLERDLLLEPAQQTAEDGWIVADAYTNPPCTIVSATERRSRSIPAGALFAALLAVFAMLRRL